MFLWLNVSESNKTGKPRWVNDHHPSSEPETTTNLMEENQLSDQQKSK